MPISELHEGYPAWAEMAHKVRAMIAGANCVKHATGEEFVPRPLGMTKLSEYKAYMERGVFFNAFKRTLVGYRGMILRTDASWKVPSGLEPLMEDITMGGDSLNDVIRTLIDEQLGCSRIGVLVDYDTDAGRPKVATYSGENIINWRGGVANGKTQAVLYVLTENVQGPDPKDFLVTATTVRFRALFLEEQDDGRSIYKQRIFDDGDKAWNEFSEEIVPTMHGVPLDFIPFLVVNAANIGPDTENPTMWDLIEENVGHYRLSCDHRWALHFSGLPTPYATGTQGMKGGKQFALGSSKILYFPAADSKIDFLETKGNGPTQIANEMLATEHRMAILGARLLEGNTRGTETAYAMSIRHSGDTATLSDVVNNAEIAITKFLTWMAQWNSDPIDKIKVKLNKDYVSDRMDAPTLMAFIQGLQNGAISPETFVHQLAAGEILSPETDEDIEIGRLKTLFPLQVMSPTPLRGQPGTPGISGQPGSQAAPTDGNKPKDIPAAGPVPPK